MPRNSRKKKRRGKKNKKRENYMNCHKQNLYIPGLLDTPQDMSAVTFTGTYYNQLIKRENCKLLEPLLEVRYVAMAVHTAVATANSLSETRK